MPKPNQHPPETRLQMWANLVGANCRRLRIDAGLSFEDVADATGLSPAYICNLERYYRPRTTPRRTNPTLEVLILLADAYQVAPAELLLPDR